MLMQQSWEVKLVLHPSIGMRAEVESGGTFKAKGKKLETMNGIREEESQVGG